MMTKEQYNHMARNLSIRGIRLYIQRLRQEEDLIGGEDKRLIIEQMEKIIEDLRENRTEQYKKRAETAEATLERLHELEDCDEEFEI